jgi:hypothetical protein
VKSEASELARLKIQFPLWTIRALADGYSARRGDDWFTADTLTELENELHDQG